MVCMMEKGPSSLSFTTAVPEAILSLQQKSVEGRPSSFLFGNVACLDAPLLVSWGDRTTLREKLGEGGIGSLCGVELLGYAWKVAHLCDQPTPAYSRPSIRPLSQTYLSYLYARVHGHPLLRQSRWIPGVRCSLCRVRDLQRSSLLIKSAIARTSITTTPSPSGF